MMIIITIIRIAIIIVIIIVIIIINSACQYTDSLSAIQNGQGQHSSSREFQHPAGIKPMFSVSLGLTLTTKP